MSSSAEYRSRAAECDDFARMTKDLGMREALLDLAAQWREAAQDQPLPGKQARCRRIWVDPAITREGGFGRN